jgi:hypothetical protein
MGEGTEVQPTDGSPNASKGTPRKKMAAAKKLIPMKMKKNLRTYVIFRICVFVEPVCYKTYVFENLCVF